MNFKQHLTPVKIAVFLTVLLILWLALGERKSAHDQAPREQQKPPASLTQVEVRQSQAELHDHELLAQGQLVPWQQVTLTARVGGRIETLVKQEGEAVKSGDTLLIISDEGRSARLSQAQATVKLRERELANAQALKRSDFVAETEIRRFESALAEANADLIERELALRYSAPSAPFDGVVNQRYVDPGEWVSVGTPLMDLVKVERLRLAAFVPQQKVSELSIGQTAQIALLDGRVMEGKLTFVSSAADSQTRSYRVEASVPNPERWRVAGASATLRVHLNPVLAHRFSPALLSLNSQGRLGVKVVNEQNTVVFYPVETLSVDTEAALVAGLPEAVRLITRGAGFVEIGQHVTVVEAQ